jgi:hypothetical protein
MFKVTVYSNWEKTREHLFDTLEEAEEFAKEMEDHQFQAIVDEEEAKEL